MDIATEGDDFVVNGRKWWCTGAGSLPKCTEAQITDYISDVLQTIHAAGMRHLLHVDGPFWDGCPALPGGATCNASAWDVAAAR